MILRFALLLVLALGASTRADAEENIALRYIGPFNVQELGVPGVMREVAKRTGVPIGLELDLIWEQQRRISFDFPGGTVALLAEMGAQLIPDGQWEILNDRSILMHSKGRAFALGSLPINYVGASKTDRRRLWESLSGISEVSSWLEASNCKRLEFFSGSEWRGDALLFSIDKGRTTLQALLEDTAVQSRQNFWEIIKNSRDGQCEISIVLW